MEILLQTFPEVQQSRSTLTWQKNTLQIKIIPIGTVMAVGGEAETRAAKVSDFAIGVISINSAYLMNAETDGQSIIALKRFCSRVKRIRGPKDRLYMLGKMV